MEEYKVTIKMRKNDGLLPDFFGKEQTSYVKGESAGEIERMIHTTMKENFGCELYGGGLSYEIKEITKV